MSLLPDNIKEAVKLIKASKKTVAFTGAGISVESGIPPFRGPEGIWSRYDPEILDIGRYHSTPEECWPAIYELFYKFFAGAKPNRAHEFLAFLESKKLLSSVITQNIDNLHQDAGNTDVIEYHGNLKSLLCTDCGERYQAADLTINLEIPRCKKDGAVLKPDFVFFGEPIPEKAIARAVSEVSSCDLLLIIGTTGEVMPASMVPHIARNSGSKIIEINTEYSSYTGRIVDTFLEGKAGEVSSLLQDNLT